MFLARVIAYANHISLRSCTIAGEAGRIFSVIRQSEKTTPKMYGILEEYIQQLQHFRQTFETNGKQINTE